MTSADKPVRLLHLVGSAVDDFRADLSRLYAEACLRSLLTSTKYAMHVAYVSPDGSWRFPAQLSVSALENAPALTLSDAVAYIRQLGVDAMIPQMFCVPGMTSYRALFDELGIPYLGNSANVMAIGVDKHRARSAVATTGVAVPAAQVMGPGERPTLPYPIVVKPIDTDNSVAVSLAHNPDEYDAAAALALTHSSVILAEAYIELGREVRCGIIVRDGELICLPLEEYAMDSTSKPIRTSEDKLARTATGDLYLVAKERSRAWIVDDDELLTQRVWAAARRCHRALGCRHYSLFDFRIDPDGRPWFLEAGLYCSYAPDSVLAVMAAAAGIPLSQLFEIGLRELEREGAPCLTSPR